MSLILLYVYFTEVKVIWLTSLHPGLVSSCLPSAGLVEALFLQMYPNVFSHMWSAHFPSCFVPNNILSLIKVSHLILLWVCIGFYLSSDEHTVLLQVCSVRRLIAQPVCERDRGAIWPFKQHLAFLVVQANPEHIGRHWGFSYVIMWILKWTLKWYNKGTLTVSHLRDDEALLFYVAYTGQISPLFMTGTQSVLPHVFTPVQVVTVPRVWNPVIGAETGLVFACFIWIQTKLTSPRSLLTRNWWIGWWCCCCFYLEEEEEDWWSFLYDKCNQVSSRKNYFPTLRLWLHLVLRSYPLAVMTDGLLIKVLSIIWKAIDNNRERFSPAVAPIKSESTQHAFSPYVVWLTWSPV